MEYDRDDDEESEEYELDEETDDDDVISEVDGILGFGVGHHAASYTIH